MCFSSSRNSCPTVFLRIQCDANEQVNKNTIPKPKYGTHSISQPKEYLGLLGVPVEKDTTRISHKAIEGLLKAGCPRMVDIFACQKLAILRY